MSYCSENKLPLATPKSRLFEVLELLGFQRIQDSAKIEESEEISLFFKLMNGFPL